MFLSDISTDTIVKTLNPTMEHQQLSLSLRHEPPYS